MSMTLVQTVTVGSGGAANIQFTAIPQDATDLLLVFSLRSNNSAVEDYVSVRPNGSTTFTNRYLLGTGSVATSSDGRTAYSSANNSTSNTFGNGQVYFANYTGSPVTYSADAVTEHNGTTAYQILSANSFASGPVTSISIVPANGSLWMEFSSASLYKITKA